MDTGQRILNSSKGKLIDPLANQLLEKLEWVKLKNFQHNKSDLFPIAITGEGPPVILLHGFDSSFLEFRRLVPLLNKNYKLIIPDLFGFGFSPRHKDINYGPNLLIKHVIEVLEELVPNESVGLIGASMGGALALKVAYEYPEKFNRLLLLSPAGLTGRPMPLIRPFDQLGVWFLRQKFVRKELCKQAFAYPQETVGPAEEEIASLHLSVLGWGNSLATFARNGGLSGCGTFLPTKPMHVLWGEQDRILTQKQKLECKELFGEQLEVIKHCGHLPHIDQPELTAERWIEKREITEKGSSGNNL